MKLCRNARGIPVEAVVSHHHHIFALVLCALSPVGRFSSHSTSNGNMTCRSRCLGLQDDSLHVACKSRDKKEVARLLKQGMLKFAAGFEVKKEAPPKGFIEWVNLPDTTGQSVACLRVGCKMCA